MRPRPRRRVARRLHATARVGAGVSRRGREEEAVTATSGGVVEVRAAEEWTTYAITRVVTVTAAAVCSAQLVIGAAAARDADAGVVVCARRRSLATADAVQVAGLLQNGRLAAR